MCGPAFGPFSGPSNSFAMLLIHSDFLLCSQNSRWKIVRKREFILESGIGNWKQRFYNYRHSFYNPLHRNQAAISRWFWSLRDRGLTHKLSEDLLRNLLRLKASKVVVIFVWR